jgi:hypothetical protein
MHNTESLISLVSLWTQQNPNKIFVHWPFDDPEETLNKINSNPDSIFFIIGFDRPTQEHYTYIDNQLHLCQYNAKNVFLLNEDYIYQTYKTQELKCIQPLDFCHDSMANISFLIDHKYKIDEEFKVIQTSNNKWLCLNRIMRRHRRYVCTRWLRGEFTDNIVYSCGKRDFFGNVDFYNSYQNFSPWVANALNLFSLKNIYNSTCGSIVVETSVIKTPPLTEKTFHAFLALHPIMIVGIPGIVSHLRDQGFDMFDDIIDHSYDSIKNSFKRTDRLFLDNQQLILNGIDRVNIESRLKKNREHVWKYYSQELKNLEIKFNKLYDNTKV